MKAIQLNIEEKEVESFETEEDFAEYLREVYSEEVNICGMMMDPVSILREMDPIAFRCAMNDAQEYRTVYTCPECDSEYDEREEAIQCCHSGEWMCSECESEHDTQEEAEACCLPI